MEEGEVVDDLVVEEHEDLEGGGKEEGVVALLEDEMEVERQSVLFNRLLLCPSWKGEAVVLEGRYFGGRLLLGDMISLLLASYSFGDCGKGGVGTIMGVMLIFRPLAISSSRRGRIRVTTRMLQALEGRGDRKVVLLLLMVVLTGVIISPDQFIVPIKYFYSRTCMPCEVRIGPTLRVYVKQNESKTG